MKFTVVHVRESRPEYFGPDHLIAVPDINSAFTSIAESVDGITGAESVHRFYDDDNPGTEDSLAYVDFDLRASQGNRPLDGTPAVA